MIYVLDYQIPSPRKLVRLVTAGETIRTIAVVSSPFRIRKNVTVYFSPRSRQLGHPIRQNPGPANFLQPVPQRSFLDILVLYCNPTRCCRMTRSKSHVCSESASLSFEIFLISLENHANARSAIDAIQAVPSLEFSDRVCTSVRFPSSTVPISRIRNVPAGRLIRPMGPKLLLKEHYYFGSH
jgi:hypothetical protein